MDFQGKEGAVRWLTRSSGEDPVFSVLPLSKFIRTRFIRTAKGGLKSWKINTGYPSSLR
jgi:hypothetical protein